MILIVHNNKVSRPPDKISEPTRDDSGLYNYTKIPAVGVSTEDYLYGNYNKFNLNI